MLSILTFIFNILFSNTFFKNEIRSIVWECKRITTEYFSLLFLLQVENPPDPPDNYGGRKSPYDNVQPRRLPPRKRPSTLPLFIGEHTDIDDMLGDTAILCRSPVLSRVRKQERKEGEAGMNLTSLSDRCYRTEFTQYQSDYPMYRAELNKEPVKFTL